MGDLMITVEAMQDIKSKLYGDYKKDWPLAGFDQLVLVGAVASNKEDELVFENSSSALEALRKLNDLKIFCAMDDGVEFTSKLNKGALEFKKGNVTNAAEGIHSKSTCHGGNKVRALKSNKTENTGKKKMKYSQPLATRHQDLPEEFKRKIETMGGCPNEARLVIEKELYCTDLEKSANRLSLPSKQLLCLFLEKDEVELLEMPGRELRITLIDPMVEEEAMWLTRWNYRVGFSYVLRTEWKKVADKNGLKAQDLIQVWSFRNKTNNRLHLAIIKRSQGSDYAGCSSSSSSKTSNASTIVDGECS